MNYQNQPLKLSRRTLVKSVGAGVLVAGFNTISDSFSILLIPMKPGRSTRPLFRVPASNWAFGFDILRYTPSDQKQINTVLAYNRTLYDRCRDLGGTNYPISAVHLSREDWKRPYGAQWETLRAGKRHYDPASILAAGPDIFRT